METDYLLYRSSTQLKATDPQCAAILAAARERNARLNLTGYLHYEDGQFFQWLEGPRLPLAEVAAMIERDRRHRDLRYLWRGSQSARQFDGWTMGFGVTDPGTLFNWIASRNVRVRDEARFARALLEFMTDSDVRSGALTG